MDSFVLQLHSGMNMIHIIFDIDNVLALGEGAITTAVRAYLKSYSAIIMAAGYEHYLQPGTIELIKYLFSMADVRISFFSSGDNTRNHEFVRELLTLALGKKKYEEVKAFVLIKSKEHLKPNEHPQINSPFNGLLKKNISCLQRADVEIDQTIFIDNDPSYVCLEQARHYLYCPEASNNSYYDLECDVAHNDAEINMSQVNNIFYIAGMLQAIISETRTHSKKATDVLMEKQAAISKVIYYQEGLRLLSRINSRLRLLTREIFQQFMKDTGTKSCEKLYLDTGVFTARFCRQAEKTTTTFRDLVKSNEFVDKSLALHDRSRGTFKAHAILFPDHVGGRILMSMMQHFYAAEVNGQSTQGLFDGLAISHYPADMQERGKRTVVYLDFSDLQTFDAPQLTIMLHQKIVQLYQEHNYVLPCLSEKERQKFNQVFEQKQHAVDLLYYMRDLLVFIKKFNKSRTSICDKYAAPFVMVYRYDRFLEHIRHNIKSCLQVMQHFFLFLDEDEGLYDRAFLVGKNKHFLNETLQLFPGIVCSSTETNTKGDIQLLDRHYGRYAGFTSHEVTTLLLRNGLPVSMDQLTDTFKLKYVHYTYESSRCLEGFTLSTCHLGYFSSKISAPRYTPSAVMDHIRTRKQANPITNHADEHTAYDQSIADEFQASTSLLSSIDSDSEEMTNVPLNYHYMRL